MFAVLDTTSKNKKSILFDKTFMVDIVDKVSSSKVEKLINVYGGVSFLIYLFALRIILSVNVFIVFISTVCYSKTSYLYSICKNYKSFTN